MQTSTDYQIDWSTPSPWYQMERDMQLRMFGWALLFLWIGTVFYMTRDFFFPGRFRIPSDQISLTPSRITSIRHNKHGSRGTSVRSNKNASRAASFRSVPNASKEASQSSGKHHVEERRDEEAIVELSLVETAKQRMEETGEKCVIEIASM